MKWPCSLQYVGVFPKYLYTNRWSAFTTAKCEIRCEMHWNTQRSKPNWDLFLHALRRSVCGRDLSVVPLTFCIFVERTSKIMNNYYKSIVWRTFQLTSKSFSLSFHKSAANWHWHQTSALLSLFGSPKKKYCVWRWICFLDNTSQASEICCRKSCTWPAEPQLRLDVRWKGLYLHWSLTNAGVEGGCNCLLVVTMWAQSLFSGCLFPKACLCRHWHWFLHSLLPEITSFSARGATTVWLVGKPAVSSSFRCERAQAHHWRCSSVVIFQPIAPASTMRCQ